MFYFVSMITIYCSRLLQIIRHNLNKHQQIFKCPSKLQFRSQQSFTLCPDNFRKVTFVGVGVPGGMEEWIEK